MQLTASPSGGLYATVAGMNTKTLALVLGAIVLIGAAFYIGRSQKVGESVPAQTAATTTAATAAQPAAMAPSGEQATYSWKFTAAPEKGGNPQTKVTLTTGGKTYDAGTYEGSCQVNTMGGGLMPGEKAAATCWFAGAGDELGVFEEGGKIVLKHGELQEASGEGDAFRGNFKVLTSL